MKYWQVLSGLLMLFALATGTQAQDDVQIQEFYSLVSPENEFVYFDLFGMEAGTTIYIYAESEAFDTYIGVCDIDCEDIYAENDDINFAAGNVNSALEYTFTADGDYSIFITDCCVSDAEGVFRLVMGFNAPQILDGRGIPTGTPFAIPWEPTYTDLDDTQADISEQGARVQQFYGTITADEPVAYYDIFDAQAGDTLYVYAESDTIDTLIGVCDIDCEEIFIENDDIDFAAGNVNSALEYTFTADGDYSIAVIDCCDESATGDFRLLLGYNDPQILTGDAVPTGSIIAEEYDPVRPPVATTERDESGSCETLELMERPQLSGETLTADTENFRIHYTLTGEDATTEAFVQSVVDYVESTLKVQIEAFGWPLPPNDCGEGGDTRFDFYLMETLDEDIMGYASTGNIIGDNPASERVETWAAYSHLVIDNDFRGMDNPLSVMRATVAHEFNHSIQFGYDVRDALPWYYEATASWIETRALPLDQDATGYTDSVFALADLCIGNVVDDQTGLRIYGEWLLIDSIAQDFGDEAILRLWELVADYEGMDVWYRLLDELQTTPQTVLARYAVRNILRAYPLGDEFPSAVIVEGSINGIGTYTPRFTGLQELSADYLFIRRKGVYTFSIDDPDLSLMIIGIKGNQDTAQVFDLGQRGTVDVTPFSHAYVAILNNAEHDNPDACSFRDWSLQVDDGTGQATVAPISETFDAQFFAPTG